MTSIHTAQNRVAVGAIHTTLTKARYTVGFGVVCVEHFGRFFTFILGTSVQHTVTILLVFNETMHNVLCDLFMAILAL